MTRRDRTVRRAALAVAAAGITILGVATLPLAASAATIPPSAAATSEDPASDESKDGTYRYDPERPKGHGGAAPGNRGDDRFPPFDEAVIVPGVEMLTEVDGGTASCTANFVYTSGDRVFIGYAAHCAGGGSSTDVNGCTTPTSGPGTPVTIRGLDGADYAGELAYTSWFAMQEAGESDPDLCQLNDFALVEIGSDDVGRVNPSVPVFGGPDGLDEDGLDSGERVFSYQNAADDGPLPVMRAKQGMAVQEVGGGRSHIVATTTPGFPGDSGSGYLDGNGRAFGVLSTIFTEDGVIFNGVADLAMALDYAAGHSDLDGIAVVDGTEPFSAAGVPMSPLPDMSGDTAPDGLRGLLALLGR